MSGAAGTVNAMLERAARDGETGLRLLDRRERESWLGWRELHERASSAASGLAALGVRKGDRVVLVYPTGEAFFEAFFAVLLAGGVPVPLYPPMRLGRMDEYLHRTARMMRRAGSVLVLAEKSYRERLQPAVEEAAPRFGSLDLCGLERGPAPEATVRDSDLALIQFSSGTTGEPKPVALSHRAVVWQATCLNSFWPDHDGLRNAGVSWLPLYHDMGLIGGLMSALERPGTLTLLSPDVFVSRPALWLRAISRYRATISPAPNFAYALCADRIHDDELEGVDLSCWRVALNGAEPVVPAVMDTFSRRFEAWGFRREALTPVYGLAEAALALTFSALDQPYHARRFDRELLRSRGIAREDPGGVERVSVGQALPGFEIAIRNGRTEPLSEGRVGRVWARGPSLMEGYLGDPAASAEVLSDGWLDTGDLGFVWKDELYLAGRAKDVLVLRGRNYSPEDIEQALERVPGVQRSGAAALSYLPENGTGELVLLFVERSRGAQRVGDVETIAEACRREVLSAIGIEADLVLVVEPGTLPRTSSGKIRRRETLARLLAGALDAPPGVAAADRTAQAERTVAAEAQLEPEPVGEA